MTFFVINHFGGTKVGGLYIKKIFKGYTEFITTAYELLSPYYKDLTFENPKAIYCKVYDEHLYGQLRGRDEDSKKDIDAYIGERPSDLQSKLETLISDAYAIYSGTSTLRDLYELAADQVSKHPSIGEPPFPVESPE